MSIKEILQYMAECSAKFIFDRDPENKSSGLYCISDIRPNILYRAALVWNFTCVEKVEIENHNLFLFARDPMILIGTQNYHLWEYLQQQIENKYNLRLAIGKYDDVQISETEKSTNKSWEYLGKYLQALSESFGKENYRENMIRIFGE